jgi:quercetin dioxygenase-like cupin family protein
MTTRSGDDMTEEAFLANEDQYQWELEPDDEGRSGRIRTRTLVSGERTPTSGVSMGVFEMPPGALLDPHYHHPQEIYYVLEGEAEAYLDGEWRPLRKGDVAYFPGDAVHGARNRGTVTCAILWVFPTDTYGEIRYFSD